MFKGNNAPEGGAIYINNGAALDITSSNFSINNNNASTAGGATYSNGGNVSMRRSSDPTRPLTSVSIASNSAGNGGAIFADGGQLNIDGVQFLGNTTTGGGGALRLTNMFPPNPASSVRHLSSTRIASASDPHESAPAK